MKKFVFYNSHNSVLFMEALLKAVTASEKSKLKKKAFDISQMEVNAYEHVCGTVHCVGGWFAVANCDTTKKLDYLNGANEMAKMLGFSHSTQLCEWFEFYDGIWGNGSADFMFSDVRAYANELSDKATSMRDVYNHWEKVMKRWETATIKRQEKIYSSQ